MILVFPTKEFKSYFYNKKHVQNHVDYRFYFIVLN